MSKDKNRAKEIAGFMRRLYKRQLTTTSGGNISARCSEDTVLITPSATDKGRMHGRQIGKLDMSGTVKGMAFKPTIESNMHLEIYRRRPDVQAVIHAHPTVASAFAASDRKISTAYLAEAYVVLGEVVYVDYFCQGSRELALAVGSAIETCDCIMVRNHGVITVGRTLLEAFDRMEVLENAARTTLVCQLPGQGGVELKSEQLQELSQLFRT